MPSLKRTRVACLERAGLPTRTAPAVLRPAGLPRALSLVVSPSVRAVPVEQTGDLLHLGSPVTAMQLTKYKQVASHRSEAKTSSVRRNVRAWYVGHMARKNVEELVLEAWHTSFLVRASSRGSGFVLCVNDLGVVTNFQVTTDSHGRCEFGGTIYNSLDDVIEILRKSPVSGRDGKPLLIGEPAPVNK